MADSYVLPDEDGFFDDPLELSDVLNTALDKGVVVRGDVTLAVADIDLVKLDLGILLSALETIERRGGPRNLTSMAANLGPLILDRPARPGVDKGSDTTMGFGVVSDPLSTPDRPSAAPANQTETQLEAVARGLPERINADAKGVESGLARLVLTLIEVLRKVLEHQAVRRMEGGRLTEQEIEKLGVALLKLDGRMEELKKVFGLTDEDLAVDLGPLGRIR